VPELSVKPQFTEPEVAAVERLHFIDKVLLEPFGIVRPEPSNTKELSPVADGFTELPPL